MKKRYIVLSILLIALILCSSIGTSLAYFSTYATAKGGYIIKTEPEIHEEFTEKTKKITISNNTGASPVFVRVKVFNSSEYEMKYELGENWSKNSEDGYFYFSQALDGGQATTQLKAIIEKIPARLKDSDEFNIVVIYESVLAVAGDDGKLNMAESWKYGKINHVNG